MKTVFRLAIILALLNTTVSVAHAEVPGAGVSVTTDALLVGVLSGPTNHWSLAAYHTLDGATRVYVAEIETIPEEGVAKYGDVLADAGAISIEAFGTGARLHLSADVPDIGLVDLTVDWPYLGMTGLGCQGTWISSEFRSPSGGLGDEGRILGTIGNETVSTEACMTWGRDATGVWVAPPIG